MNNQRAILPANFFTNNRRDVCPCKDCASNQGCCHKVYANGAKEFACARRCTTGPTISQATWVRPIGKC